MGAVKEAAGIVSTAREMFADSGMEIAGKALGGLDSLVGQAAGLAGEFTGALDSCATALNEALYVSDIPSGLVKDAVGLAGEAQSALNDGWQMARQLASIKDANSFGATLGSLGNSLDAGQRRIERTSPVLQGFTARIAGRKEMA